ncbi:MAG: response regulator [Myxococcales bacterium]|nr:response regulator [Myxococcales bacterium]
MAQILVIDDSATMRQLLSTTLVEAGHQVVLAKDGMEALAIAQGSTPEVVMTDINMPRMDGLTLIKKLRAMPAYKRIPIIVLTTEIDSKKKQIAKMAGATGWVTKPFDPPKLLAAIKRVVG